MPRKKVLATSLALCIHIQVHSCQEKVGMEKEKQGLHWTAKHSCPHYPHANRKFMFQLCTSAQIRLFCFPILFRENIIPVAFPIKTMSCGTELLAGLCTTTAVITDLVGARDWLLRRCSKVYAIGGGSNGHGDFCPVHGGKKAYRIIVWVYICVCVYTHTWTWSVLNIPFFFQHWPLSTKTSYMPCKNSK